MSQCNNHYGDVNISRCAVQQSAEHCRWFRRGDLWRSSGRESEGSEMTALPARLGPDRRRRGFTPATFGGALSMKKVMVLACGLAGRSEERRVGKECRARWAPDQ